MIKTSITHFHCSIFLSVHLYRSIVPSFYLNLSSFFLAFYLSIYCSTVLSFYLPNYISFFLSIVLFYRCIILSFYQSSYLSVYLSIALSIYCSFNRSIIPSIGRSIRACLLFYPSVIVSIYRSHPRSLSSPALLEEDKNSIAEKCRSQIPKHAGVKFNVNIDLHLHFRLCNFLFFFCTCCG